MYKCVGHNVELQGLLMACVLNCNVQPCIYDQSSFVLAFPQLSHEIVQMVFVKSSHVVMMYMYTLHDLVFGRLLQTPIVHYKHFPGVYCFCVD